MDEQEIDNYLTVEEFAKYFRVSKMTIYRMCHSGEIEALKFGRQFRIPKSECQRMAGQ